MADDIDMDAPQISTLREEETPEPQPTQLANKSSKFRVKLVVGEGKRAGSAQITHEKIPYVPHSDEDEDEDDEEDQLIDDDEEEPKAQVSVPTVSVPPVVEKKTVVSKRGGSTAGRARGRGRGSRGGKTGRTDAGPALTASASIDSIATSGTAGGSISAPLGTPKKRGGGLTKTGSTRGGSRGGKRGAKQAVAVPLHMRDDAGSVSEAYIGTAASSPAAHDDRSPDVPDVPLPNLSVATASLSHVEDVSLEGVPLPTYPLPSRPFPVHPPPKIGSGFAPIIPLDKGGKRVRHWRQANREIRGIAGGRWFAKSWVGEKDSEYATAAAAVTAAMQAMAPGNMHDNVSGLGPLPIPRLPGVTIPGVGRGRPRLPKGDIQGTNPSSRAESIESISTTIPKKRTNSQMSGLDTPTVSVSVG